MIILNNLKIIEILQKIKNFKKLDLINDAEKLTALKTLQNELQNSSTYQNYVQNLTNDFIYSNKIIFVLDEKDKKASKKELSTRLLNLATANNLTIKTTAKNIVLTSKQKKDIIITIKNILQIDNEKEKELLIKLNKRNATHSDDVISNNMIKNALISCIQNKMIDNQEKDDKSRLYGTHINVNKFIQAIASNIYSLYKDDAVMCSDNYKKVMQVIKTIDEAIEKEEKEGTNKTSEVIAEDEEA